MFDTTVEISTVPGMHVSTHMFGPLHRVWRWHVDPSGSGVEFILVASRRAVARVYFMFAEANSCTMKPSLAACFGVV